MQTKNWGDFNLNIGYIDGETPPAARASNNLEFCQHNLALNLLNQSLEDFSGWILPWIEAPQSGGANLGILFWWEWNHGSSYIAWSMMENNQPVSMEN